MYSMLTSRRLASELPSYLACLYLYFFSMCVIYKIVSTLRVNKVAAVVCLRPVCICINNGSPSAGYDVSISTKGFIEWI